MKGKRKRIEMKFRVITIIEGKQLAFSIVK